MPWDFATGIGSSLLGGLFGRSNAKQQQQAQMQMTRELAQNKHQWAVGDLRKAGLNPILSATQGTPLPSASAAKADTPDFSAGLGKASAARLAREQVNTEQERQATERGQQNLLMQQAAKAFWDGKISSYEADKQQAMFELWRNDNHMSGPLRYMRALNDVGMPPGALINSGVDLFRSFNPLDLLRRGKDKKGPIGFGAQ